MTTPGDLHVVRLDQTDPRLGRHVVHDPRSRQYAVSAPREALVTRSFRHRVFNPNPMPNQAIGCCTGVAECVMGDTQGNRVRGVSLDMDDAVKVYSRATELDPFDGTYPPTDTGSSGLAAAKAATEMGIVERYEWVFGGVDQLLATLRDRPVAVGTRWDNHMFHPEPNTYLVTLGGGVAGGHEWTVIGYNKRYDAFEGQCWWGNWAAKGMFRIRRADLATLLADDGDAHVSYRKGANA